MALNLIMSDAREELKPRITVFGVGGAGGNAVNNMIDQQLEGVEFVVANTDAQALQQSKAVSRIQMGVKVTEGLGAGARPTVGAAAAEETIEEIVDHLAGAHMCFITAGMGGGTGTGAAPIIAQAARELGVLTVGVVTKPFQFEGNKRMRQAEEGIAALQKVVDTLIIIPNQNLFRLANERTTFTEAFAMADDVLYQGVKGVTDLMVRPGLINLDFADVRAVMDEMGKAMMGTGEASGEDRAVQAAEKAIANPLLDEISLHGAKGVLINITGGYDLTLFELDEAANIIREKVDPDANIIVGSTLDTSMEGTLRVSVVATGIDVTQVKAEMPVARRTMAAPLPASFTAPEPKREAPMTLTVSPVATPVAAAPVTPAPAAYAPEQSLFDREPAAQTYAPEPEDVIENDLPPPVYRPQAAAAAPRHTATSALDADPQSFVAPRPRQPGSPSPEALARLQAAVSKGPAPQPAQQRAAMAQPQATRAAAAAPKPAESRPRFGIGGLISRMAGGGHAEPAAERAPVGRAQPPVTAYDDEQEPSGDQDRIEIPAFLRRQAN
ncbi:cell division protein FtsZ [Tabrizicola oligotrophica]|uniref:Cell division protein FtsZ n=1 Tax=Tabrizicola oligotrophica TaxID=2710650 RepID=A0A6M0QVC4_9RHOB|nr:cell division protein FtsZ [Tabrizicola oligotrophica]NEY91375.1 cell division protein FtsZ [Tabrizicola oligotrophica]